MRKALLAISTVALLATAPVAAQSGTFNAAGQFVGTVSPQVTSVIATFPGGGPALSAAIALLLEQDPRLADDVVYASRAVNNRGQQRAIGAGLAQAKRFFALCRAAPTETCRSGEAQVAHAMLYADQETLLAYNESNGSVVSADETKSSSSIYLPGIGSNNCRPSVSPATTTGC